MACTIKVDTKTNKALGKLVNYCGPNCTQLYSYLTTILENLNGDVLTFTDEFKEFYKKTVGEDIDMSTSSSAKVRDVTISYYNEVFPNYQSGVLEGAIYNKIKVYGYTSIEARQYAKRVFANKMIEIYFKHGVEKGKDVKENLRDFYIRKAINAFTTTLAKRIAKLTGKNEKEIKAILVEPNSSYQLKGLLKGYENELSIPLQNLIAMYKEFNTMPTVVDGKETSEVNPQKEFLREVLYDSRLKNIRMKKGDVENVKIDNEAAEESDSMDIDSTDDQVGESSYDTTIRVLNEKLGLVADFMTHVGTPIRMLLGSLRKQVVTNDETGEIELDLDNPLGIADTMDANECATVLYHYGKYENREQMMESIKTIAKTIPGFAAFSTLHQTLEDNLNLQIQFYRTFRKIVIAKQETVTENGNGFNRISNNTNRQLILKYRFQNAFVSNAIARNPSVDMQDVAILKRLIDNYDKIRGDRTVAFNDIVTLVTNLLNNYYGDIDRLSIRNFIRNNRKTYKEDNTEVIRDVVNETFNMRVLHGIISDTLGTAAKTRLNYQTRQARIAIIKDHNKKARRGAVDENGNKLEPMSTAPIYAQPYLETEAQIIQLSKVLQDYVLVSTPLNSRTVLGKQSSDVINISMLTNIRDMLQSQLNREISTTDEHGITTKGWDPNCPLMRFAAQREKSKQYDFGPIMIEHKDEKGNIINKGLFRRDESGRFIPTEYSLTLLDVRLFQGASNLDDGANMEYKSMSKGDYIGTAWRAFFGDTKEEKQTENMEITTASYFMRIPSDAPKNFVINAPRYSAFGLMQVLNNTDITNAMKDFVNALPTNLTKSDIVRGDTRHSNSPIAMKKGQAYYNLEDFVKHLRTITGDTVNISIPLDKRKGLQNDKQYRVCFRYAPDKNAKYKENVYVMEGVYSNGTLKNAKFVGFVEDSKNEYTIDPNMWSDIRDVLWSDLRRGESIPLFGKEDKEIRLQHKVNRNHVLFKQLRNAFVQELTDMVTAAGVMFDKTSIGNGKYIIAIENGVPKLLTDKNRIVSNTKHNGLHPIYHYNNKTNEIYTVEDGKVKLNGKVFTSDRFILFDYFAEDEKDYKRNIGEEILEEAFDILENAFSIEDSLLTFDENGNVILSDLQKNVINQKIEEFINLYVDNARERLNNVKEFVDSAVALTTDNIAEFMINTHLAYIGFNDLFEGDTKFYKDAQTFLKRAKEAQGSGVPYGLIDNTKSWNASRELIKSPLDSTPVIINGRPVLMYSGFRAITIRNTVKTDNLMMKALADYLSDKKYMGNAVLTKDEAKNLMKGYAETTVNDAQSYITLQELIRRVTARGQLDEYKPLFDKLLDESQPITVEDVKKLIQVQKNFYYDQYWNEKNKTVSPRQIKNAEFVLIPRFIKGTELEIVEQMMQKLGIDQLNTLETSKASNGYVFDLWDKYGKLRKDVISDVEAYKTNKEGKPVGKYKSDIINACANPKTGAVEVYSYNFLYTQQETPQHLNDENKAGIQVMKKILDNIDDNSPKELKEAKQAFLTLYTANIKDSFVNLMSRLNVELDENGNIQIDESGNIKGLNYEVLMDILKDELIRLGLDSNMQDYCTLDPNSPMNGATIMPNYFTLAASKFENIVQSLFNNNVTRQLLPGFHAAQVTGMGFELRDVARKLSDVVNNKRTSNILQYHPRLYKKGDSVITEREYDLLTKEEQTGYVYNGVANYIEVMLPASAFGFDRSKYSHLNKEEQDELFMKQLREQGLDCFIGYRIPTEGKQSISYMKLHSFTDDSQGSTIIVPDAWVSQTGADFDIDSIYGIQYATYFGKDGKIHKYEYIRDYKTLYKKYVINNLPKGEDIKQLLRRDKLTDEQIQSIVDPLRDENGKYDNDTALSLIKAFKDNLLEKKIEDKAKELGLMSFEDFSSKPIEELNSRQARTNELIRNMIIMLTHPASFEENLSRSKFDHVSNAMDNTNVGLVRLRREQRSPYNFLDQADYHEDAISGLKLKAFSVVRDNFCSLSNAIHPFLNNNAQIKVRYTGKYNATKLKKRFGVNNVQEVRNERNEIIGYDVTHWMLGWSYDNKNISGDILTCYSSETTAHILDAMKTGNVPNVNDLTFRVYKTFVDIGSDFDTAVAFIKQPGVTRIVEEYNKTNSIYASEKGRAYIINAVRNICSELKIDYQYDDSLETLIGKVNKQYNDIFDLHVSEKALCDIAVDTKLNEDRLENKGIFKDSEEETDERDNARVRRALHDLHTILMFNKIDKLACDIGECARVCNPDKFGAKQSIFAARDTIRSIYTNIKQNKGTNEEGTSFRLRVGNNHLLSAIYPELEKAESVNDMIKIILTNPDFIAKSKYKPLAAFLKYATASSVAVNKHLFVTQTDDFTALIEDRNFGLASVLPPNKRLTEKAANAFKDYIINYVVLQSTFLQEPIKYNVVKNQYRGFVYSDTPNRAFNGAEVNRVFGYGYSPGLVLNQVYRNGELVNTEEVLTVNNINNPTQDEVDTFNLMSPAQKVAWVKANFADPGVFKYITPTLYNGANRGVTKQGSQTLTFDEDKADIETIRVVFNQTFANKNPFLACAAADVIKYAFFVEGYKIGIGNVSKTIPNSVLINGGRVYGTNIVNNSNVIMSNIGNITNEHRDELIKRFVRSNSEALGISTSRVARLNGKRYELPSVNGIVYLPGNDERNKALLEKYNITYTDTDGTSKANSYVKLRFGNRTTLYKIRPEKTSAGYMHYFLVPLNLLERNENAEWSANENNNLYRSEEYYDTIITNYLNNSIANELAGLDIDTFNAITKELDKNADKYKAPKKETTDEEWVPNLNTDPTFAGLVTEITNWYNAEDPTKVKVRTPLYVWYHPLSKYITHFGVDNGNVQSITLDTGEEVAIKISKFVNKTLVNRFVKDPSIYDKPLYTEFRGYLDAIRPQITMGVTNPYDIKDIYQITTVDLESIKAEDAFDFSTATDARMVAVKSAKAMFKLAVRGDEEAGKIKDYFSSENVKATQEGVEGKVEEVIISTGKYLEERSLAIESKLSNYIPNPDGSGYLSVDDVRTINIIKKSPKARQKYLADLLEPRTIVKDFGIIKDLNIDSEEPTIRQHLERIKKAVERMQNLSMINNAYRLFAEEIYDKETDNPLIKDKFMSVLDGYWRTNWFNATFNDIQETSNPIIQIAMRNFQRTLRAYEMNSRRRALEFVNFIEDLKNKAKSEGLEFDLNKGIESYGRIKQNHNKKFIEDRNKLMKASNDASKAFDDVYDSILNDLEKDFARYKSTKATKKLPSFGTLMLEKLKAKLAYEEWKAKHIEQPLEPEFYEKRNELLRNAIYGYDKKNDETGETEHIAGIPEKLAEYETYREILKRLRKKTDDAVENKELDNFIDYIKLLQYRLYEGMTEDEADANPLEARQREKLKQYKDSIKNLYDKYYKYDTKEGFEEKVETNKKIVESYELSGRTPDSYANNPDYVKAKRWLKRNVREIPIWDDIEDEADYETLNTAGVYIRRQNSILLRNILNNPDYKNKYGDVDPMLIPLDVIKRLKEEEATKFRVKGLAPLSDRSLISNAPESNVAYNTLWYESISVGDRTLNKEWADTVTAINNILGKWYDEVYGVVEISKIKREELDDVKEVTRLYEKLKKIRKGDNKTTEDKAKAKKVKNFIDKNADFKLNEDRLNYDLSYTDTLPKGEFRSALRDLILDIDDDGSLTGRNFLYGYMVPKDSVKDKYIDKEKTELMNIRKKLLERTLKPDYFTAKAYMFHNHRDQYDEWFQANHVYNPYEHKYQPISLWWYTKKKAKRYEYEPMFEQTKGTIRDGYRTAKEAKEAVEQELFDTIEEALTYDKSIDFTNKKYKKGLGHESNYIYGSNPEYDVEVNLNKYEQQAIDYIKEVLMSLVNTAESKRYIEKGWLPARAEGSPTDAKGWVKELLKIVGYDARSVDGDNWYEHVDYADDRAPMMPMLEQIKGKYKGKISRDLKQIRKQRVDESKEDYEKYVKETEEENERRRKDNEYIHEALIDKDWVNVISDFIVKAGTYNAVQENKYELWYAKELLNQYGSYVERYDKFGNKRLKRDGSTSTAEETEYLREPDKLLIEQFDNQLRRILYDQFKSANNPKLLKWMSVLQSFTSAQFMMLNVKGGIANVTLGDTQMLGEGFAKRFFGKELIGARAWYSAGIFDYILNSGKETSNTLQGATIKFFDIVDYDEHTGVSRITKNAAERLRKIRDYGYLPQTSGEHLMQNTALFAMLASHRLVLNPRHAEFGQPKYKFMNLEEFIQDKRREAFESVLNDKQKEKFKKYIEDVSEDANKFKDFAWLKRDFIFEFAINECDNETRRAFIAKQKELEKKAKEEFEDDSKHPTIKSQLALGSDGRLTFKKGDGSTGWLGEIDTPKEDGSPSDALILLADFKGRVISVNKYIHGVYDKSGRAQLEKTFIGSLIMQYHKHLPIGLMKRYRVKGMWSEERGAYAKGTYTSVAQFLSIPIRKHKRDLELTDDQVNAFESLQEIVKNIVDFSLHLKLFYHLLPEYDRANIRRLSGDTIGVLSSMFAVVAISLAADHDDEDSLAYNLAMYEADRLATEAGTYIPWMFYVESKKMLQSPIAAGSAVTDLLSSLNLLCHLVLEGEDFDGTYHSGKFAGEEKLKVYIMRRIPIWRGIKTSFIDVKTNNSYYKVGENMLGFFNVKEHIQEYKDNH